MTNLRTGFLALLLLLTLVASSRTPAGEACREEPPVQNWTGAGTTSCPCFVQGEEAGVVLDLPAEIFPIEILRISVGWGSLFGGAPDALEQALLKLRDTPASQWRTPAQDAFLQTHTREVLAGRMFEILEQL